MLEESIQYTKIADSKLIEIFKQHQEISPKAIALFNHVLNAQHIWANRILGLLPKYQVWETYGTEMFEQISDENFELLTQIIKNIPLDKEITYTNSLGDQYTSLAKDILFHVVNHSTYHRGQIASLFKLDGITPPVTDYIMLKRDHQL
ncbi:damage-inducible protein DinB [Pedobacter sp. LMG 31464]|uniref:Damage-inducible protein DinB n=1 Tax=Pedobacter planticolens TaxID=2679964 RepID=A0A923IWG1_9SPHI|nr:DinB family protein [Pedobacter planticolens]MBB2146878.1 damage-inducible protein DinB [Pedobacter planticolens]